MNTNDKWPAVPDTWPDILSEIETCQYLRIDLGHTIAGAKRSLRYVRRTKALPCAGRVGGRVIFRKAAIDTWLATQEALQTPPETGVTK